MSDEKPKKPRVFDLNNMEGKKKDSHGTTKPKEAPSNNTSKTATQPKAIDISDVTFTDEALGSWDNHTAEQPLTKKPGFSWGGLFFSALGILVSLAIGLAIDSLIRDLFARHSILGYVGLGVTILVIVAASALILREALALYRLRQISSLRETAQTAFEGNDVTLAQKTENDLMALYRQRPDLAKARANIADHADDVLDAKDRIALIEKAVMTPLDERASKLIMDASVRVSVVTAVSPRALVDILYVLAENLRLIRALSDLYGGRPGFFGFVQLAKNVLSHLAVTGVLSVGDGLVQQVIGHGIAARLSARFGEGVVNGLLTARIGLSAHDLCRPVPFLSAPRPSMTKYFNRLASFGVNKDKTE